MRSQRTTTSTCDKLEGTLMEDTENPRYVLYSKAFRGQHAFKGVARKAAIMTRIAQDDIFRKIVLEVRMKNGTPRVFIDKAAVTRHTRHFECNSACLNEHTPKEG